MSAAGGPSAGDAPREAEHFDTGPDPGNPGWTRWQLKRDDLYNAFLGSLIVQRRDTAAGRIAAMRMVPATRHANLAGAVHGGTIMGLVDCALFAGGYLLTTMPPGFAVTVELQTHFTAAAPADAAWLEAQVEVVRETGGFLFERGLVVAAGVEPPVASFTGLIRKAPRAQGRG